MSFDGLTTAIWYIAKTPKVSYNQNTKMQERTWKIGGVAGMGIKSTGDIMTRICAESGWYVFDYSEYPSLIRGGHNTYHVRAGSEPVRSTVKEVQVLVALNEETIRLDFSDVVPGGALIYDPSEFDPDKITAHRDDVHYLAVPLHKLAVEDGGAGMMKDTVAVGASLAAFNGDLGKAIEVIKRRFAAKGKWLVEGNAGAASRGYAYVKGNFPNALEWKLNVLDEPERIVLPGNEAIGLGAIASGLQFFAAYPMTPASSILHYLSRVGPNKGVVVKHAEDEIGAINMAIGGSFAGLRTMTATSGGGFSLMTEALSLSAMTETPLVIVNAQRPGPATGLPTWTEQSDLQFILHAGSGEFPRIVLAPGNVQECFQLGAESLNFAERYQLPVFILTDKLLAESQEAVKPFTTRFLSIDRGKRINPTAGKPEGEFKRYAFVDDGISLRSIPGTPDHLFLANSDEHNEAGFTDESSANRQKMMDKRHQKLLTAVEDLPMPFVHGPEEADVTLVGWGSTMGAILDAMRLLEERGIHANFLRIVVLSPFPTDYVKSILEKSGTTVLIENNSQGQLGALIREHTGIDIDYHVLKYDGRPFFPEEVAEKIEHILI